MNRREWTLATATLAALPGFALAQASGEPREGREYAVLEKRVPTEVPAGKVEVIEFFWYSCPHCNAFEPTMESWIKAAPADVVVKRVPVAFRADFQPQQKLYYTLEALNNVDEFQMKVFNAVHRERQALNTDDAIIAWAVKQGFERAKFTEAYQSFSVATKVRRAVQLQDAYKVEGVPSLGIGGRFYTDGTMAGSMERALQVTTFLIERVRKNR